MVRNSSEARLLGRVLETVKRPELDNEATSLVRATYGAMMDMFQIDTIISLDLQWLFLPSLFTGTTAIQKIHSIWFDDLRSWTLANNMFAECRQRLPEHIRHPKVTHYFYGENQLQESRLLGIDAARLSHLAAPYEYTLCENPCEIRERAAFVGNPGLREPVPDSLMTAIRSGMEIDQLRRLTAETFAQDSFPKKDAWIKEEPTVRGLLAMALDMRVQSPHRCAVEILKAAAAHYPLAYTYLEERNKILEAALIVKLVNCCDRPAAILHLYKKGLIDVISGDKEWLPYGIKALPTQKVTALPAAYQKYAVHLNAANALRDATANEKLFEIAACGRVSINLDSPDVAACYDDTEIVRVNSLAELEAQTRALLADPEKALAMGANARARTAREHLWEHRLQAIF